MPDGSPRDLLRREPEPKPELVAAPTPVAAVRATNPELEASRPLRLKRSRPLRLKRGILRSYLADARDPALREFRDVDRF